MNESQYIEPNDSNAINGPLQYNTKGMSHGYSSSALREMSTFTPQQLNPKNPVKLKHMNTMEKNHHYSTSSKLIGPTSTNLIDTKVSRANVKNTNLRKPN